MNIPKGTGDYLVNLTIGQMHAFLKEDGMKFMAQSWRVICPACSKWTVADTYGDAMRQFELHLACAHPNLSTSVKPVQYTRKEAQ